MPPAGQAIMVRTIVNKYRAGARAELLKEYPDIEKQVESNIELRQNQLRR